MGSKKKRSPLGRWRVWEAGNARKNRRRKLLLEQLEDRRYLAVSGYTFDILARTGEHGLTGLGQLVSVNDFGRTVFWGSTEEGDGIYVADTDLSSGTPAKITGDHDNFRGTVQINESGNVAAIRQFPNPTINLEVWDPVNTGTSQRVTHSVTGGSSVTGLSRIFSHASISDDGSIAFVAQDGSGIVGLFRTTVGVNSDLTLVDVLGTGAQPLVRPMIARGGRIVMRDPLDQAIKVYDGQSATPIAGAFNGFESVGALPGISDSGQLVAFYGDVNSEGAARLETTAGPGIFIAINSGGAWVVQRVAGASANDQLDPGETYTDQNSNGHYDPGELDRGATSSFVPDGSIGVSDFTAKRFANVVYEAQNALGSELIAMSHLEPSKTVVGPLAFDIEQTVIARTGQSVFHDGNGNGRLDPGESSLAGTVTELSLHDPLTNEDSSDVAFWVKTSSGAEGIVRAVPEPIAVLNIVTHGFNPNPLSPNTFLATWHQLADALDKIPEPNSALEGRVATHVSHWDSTSSFLPGFAFLLLAKINDAIADVATEQGNVARAQQVKERADKFRDRVTYFQQASSARALQAALEVVANAQATLLPVAESRERQRIHLIGHSRGAAVNAIVSEALTLEGYVVDQFTALDGFSTDWPNGAGLLGDVDIAEYASGSRKVNYQVEAPIDQDPLVLSTLFHPAVVFGALLLDIDEIPTLVLNPNVRERLAEFDMRAPERSGFENIVLTAASGTGTTHTNITSEYLRSADKDAAGNYLRPESQRYLLDNYVGENRAATELPEDQESGDGSAESPPITSAEELFASITTGFRNVTDGSFEELGAAVLESINGDPQLDEPTENPLLDLWWEIANDPQVLLGSTWTVRGDVELKSSPVNTVAQLTQTIDTSLGQTVFLDSTPQQLDFDMSIDAAGPGDKLEIVFDGEVISTVDLSSHILLATKARGIGANADAPLETHYSIPLVGISGRGGGLTLRLAGPDDEPSRIRVDNLNIVEQSGDQRPSLEAIGDQFVVQGDELEFPLTTPHFEGVVYELGSDAPAQASIDSETGVFKWTPQTGSPPGIYRVTIRVSHADQEELADWETFSVVEFTPALDESFGDSGSKTVSVLGSLSDAGAFALEQPDGKIVLVGDSLNNITEQTSFSLVRYTADGQVDASFGENGQVTTLTGEAVVAAEVQPDGKLIVAGSKTIVRYTSDGTIDTTFGTNGFIMAPWGSNGAVRDISLTPDGDLIVGGRHYVIESGFRLVGNVALAKYDANGQLVTSFGDEGITYTDLGGEDDVVELAVGDTGEIFVAAIARFDFGRIVRYTPDGVVDNNFGTNGFVDLSSRPTRMKLSPDDGIYVVDAFRVTRKYAVDGEADTTFGSDGVLDLAPVDFAVHPDGTLIFLTTSGLTQYVDGQLDTTFGESGTAEFPTDFRFANSILVLASGDLLTAGTRVGTQIDAATIRYSETGELDGAFGTSGIASTDIQGTAITRGFVSAVQADGKVLVAGSVRESIDTNVDAYDGREWLFLARHHPDGSLDETFGDRGIVKWRDEFQTVRPFHLAVQADGKILALVNSDMGVSFSRKVLFIRFNPDASLDTTFADSGIGVTDFFGAASAAFVHADHGVTIVGTLPGGQDEDAVIRVGRFDLQGQPDPTFGEHGLTTLTLGGFHAHAVAVQADGKIVIGGRASSDFAVVRLNVDGSLDETFDLDGRSFTAFEDASVDKITSLHLNPDGRILAGGESSNGNRSYFALARFNSDGTLDKTFGVAGRTRTAIGDHASIRQLLPLNEDAFLAFGTSDGDFAIARYQTNGAMDYQYARGGVELTDLGGTDVAHAGLLLTDGSVFIVGERELASSIPYADYDAAIVRFKTQAPTATVEFAESSYATSEKDGHVQLTIRRRGDLTRAVTVHYATGNGTAFERRDYTPITGSVELLPNQSTAVISIPLLSDNDVEGAETFAVQLIEVSGGAILGNQSAAKVPISDADQPPLISPVALQQVLVGQSWTLAINAQDPEGDHFLLSLDQNAPAGVTLDSETRTLRWTPAANQPAGIYEIPLRAIQENDPRIFHSATIRVAVSAVQGLLGPNQLFGQNGVSQIDFTGHATDEVSAIVEQPDGKTLVLGKSTGRPLGFQGEWSDFGIARFNTDGSLDASFGNGGRVTTPFGSTPTSHSNARKAAIQPDGKIVIVGSTFFTPLGGGPSVASLALARYLSDGRLDPEFGEGGKVTGILSPAADVALQADGKILVVTDKSVARFNSNGQIDETFGVAGVVTVSFGTTSDTLSHLNLDSNGKIVVAGKAWKSGNPGFSVARILPDGTFDPEFGTDGKYSGLIGSNTTIEELVVLEDGSMFLAGSTHDNQTQDLVIIKLLSSGDLDAEFGTEGVLTANVGTQESVKQLVPIENGVLVAAIDRNEDQIILAKYDASGTLVESFGENGVRVVPLARVVEIADLRLDPTGGALVGATVSQDGDWDFSLTRFDASGALDLSYGERGRAETDMPTSRDDFLSSLTITAAEELLLVGTSWRFEQNFALARLSTDGSLDPTFGEAGQIQSSFAGNTTFSPSSVVALDDGKFLISGSAQLESPGGGFTTVFQKTYLSRFTKLGQPDGTFGQGGYVETTDLFTYQDPIAIGILSDGRIVAAGQKPSWPGQYDITLAVFTPNGELDPNFGDGGVLSLNFGGDRERALKLVVQGDDKIVLLLDESEKTQAIIRLEANGRLDRTFGQRGKVTGLMGAQRIYRQNAGRILFTDANGISRLTPDGQIDLEFGVRGRIQTGQSPALITEADGKLLVTSTQAGGTRTIVRYHPNGSRDTDFGQPVVVPFGHEITLAPNGDILISGTADDPLHRTDDFSVVAYSYAAEPPDNHAPEVAAQLEPKLLSIDEDTVSNPGTSINELLASVAPNLITDQDAGAVRGVAVTYADQEHGSWEFSIDDGVTWLPLGQVSDSSARLLADRPETRIRFLPEVDYAGSASIRFHAWDQTFGVDGGLGDPTLNGGWSAFSVAAATASIEVRQIPDFARLVRDLNPGEQWADPQELTAFQGQVYFSALGPLGRELWRSDGTANGTVMVKDIAAGEEDAWVANLTPVGNHLYFTAFTADQSQELWRTDGTEGGTVMVKEIGLGPEPAHIHELVNVNGTLFFTADDGEHGKELWKSDGTEAGTEIVRDIVPDGVFSDGPYGMFSAGGLAFFTLQLEETGRELWRSDGTSDGTFLVSDIVSGPSSSIPRSFTEFRGMLFFIASDETGWANLWKTDGTQSGTQLISQIFDNTGQPRSVVVVGDELYFFAGSTFWKSDGSSATRLIDGLSAATGLAGVGSNVFFSGTDYRGAELWKLDRTTARISLIMDIAPGGEFFQPISSDPFGITPHNGHAIFSASTLSEGRELWRSDGSGTQTVLIQDIEPGDQGSDPRDFVEVGGKLFFTAFDRTRGRELWVMASDPPSTSGFADIHVTEDAASSVLDLFAAFEDDVNPDNTLFYSVVQNTNAALFESIDIDAAEGKLTIDYRADAHGEALLVVRATDASGRFVDATVTVTVDSVNDPPTIAFPGDQQIDDANDLLFRETNGTAIQIAEPDADELSVLMNVTTGALHVTETDQLAEVTGNGSSTISLKGTATELNVALASLAYRPVLGHVGEVGLEMIVTEVHTGNEETRQSNIQIHESPRVFAVRDINPIKGSEPHELINFNDVLLFTAFDAEHGLELWRRDSQGTTLVKDIRPGPAGSNVRQFYTAANVVYFSADDGTHGGELWRTDGTAEGTQLVADIYQHSASAFLLGTRFAFAHDTLFFTAYTADLGIALYKTDGTGDGTVLVKDISTSFSNEQPPIIAANGRIFFVIDDGQHGKELWTTDGTEEGTVLVKDIHTSGSSAPSQLVALNGILFFSAHDGVHGTELWRSDGTSEGTRLVRDIQAGPASSSPDSLTVLDEALYFSANDGQNGTELWKSDGTPEGTTIVKNIAALGSSAPQGLAVLGSELYFSAAASSGGGLALYKTDGTAEGTAELTQLSTPITSMAKVGDDVFFVAADTGHGTELWRTDGSGGSDLVKDIYPGSTGSNPGKLVAVDDRVYFSADDGEHGRELWSSDGTEQGTEVVRDIMSTTRSSSPASLRLFRNQVLFVADGGTGRGVWKTDGTEAGTSFVQSFVVPTSFADSAEAHGHLYFGARPLFGVYGLYRTDGTASGTKLVKTIDSSFLALPTNVTAVGERIFFTANDGRHGNELWISDGTADGTELVLDIPFGHSSPSDLVNFNGILYFSASTADTGRELWRSDGTAEGTHLVSDLRIGSGNSSPRDFTVLDNVLFFTADTGTNGRQLWTTDGTAEGTRIVRGLDMAVNADPRELIVAGESLFFRAKTADGIGLFRSDGTNDGTQLVKDFGAHSSFWPANLTRVGNTLYFMGSDIEHGVELWTSDGTAAGTRLVTDLQTGHTDADLQNLTAANGQLVFTWDDGQHGRELWATDGTARGTRKLADLFPGATGSDPTNLLGFGNSVLFAADDGTMGVELWRAIIIPPADVEENQPPTDVAISGTSVPENLAGGIVGDVTVSDPDVDQTHTFVLSDTRFEIVAGKLRLRPDESLDFESQNTITVEITATDSGVPSETIVRSFSIEVLDANDSPTALSLSNLTIKEKAEGAVVGQLSVQDQDAGQSHTFSVSDPRFEVVAGELRLKSDQSLDFESEKSITVEITATDSGVPSETIVRSFSIEVLDANDSPTALSLSNLTIKEEIDGEIVGQLSVQDQDAGQSHTFVLSDPRFEIVAGKLQLKPDQSLDFESEKSITVQVSATDSGVPPETIVRSFSIEVSDSNDVPTALSLSSLTLKEKTEGAVVGQLSVQDQDTGQSHTFSVSDERFEISDNTLRLKSGVFLERSAGSEVAIEITVQDSGNPPQSTTKTFRVAVLENAAPWHHADLPPDTNADGTVVPLDALRIINLLNNPTILGVGGRLPASRAETSSLPFYDTNQDGFCSPLDALVVINYLNSRQGESESHEDIVWAAVPTAAWLRTATSDAQLTDVTEVLPVTAADEWSASLRADSEADFDGAAWLDDPSEWQDLERYLDELAADCVEAQTS